MEVNRLQTAIDHLHTPEIIAILTEPKLLDKTPIWVSLNQIGRNFFIKCACTEALELHGKALEIAESDLSSEALYSLTSLKQISQCLFALNRYQEQRYYIRKAYTLLDEADANLKSELWWELGLSYLREQQFENAYLHFRSALQYSSSPTVTASIFNKLGRCCYLQGLFQKALNLHQMAYAHLALNQIPDCFLTAESLTEIGDCLNQLGESSNAKAHWIHSTAILKHLKEARDTAPLK